MPQDTHNASPDPNKDPTETPPETVANIASQDQTPPAGTDVYAIHGADPEVLAYAMAKYSRSSLTLKESIAEISAGRAEQFLNTFYFQYGHRSIADLAHIPFAIECLSLLAAIDLVDEQRWDGQERSTRYQDFRKSGWFTPDLGPATPTYTAGIQSLFQTYEAVGAKMLEALQHAIPRPETMKPEAYSRTLKARAFDVARYLLPLATNTSLGQIVNARTLETQVSRLLSSPFPEIRLIGEKLRAAAAGPAWNPQKGAREVKSAPTLVKYAAPNPYLLQTRQDLTAAAADLMGDATIELAPVVDLLNDTNVDEPLDLELATSLLYPHSHFSYRQLRHAVSSLAEHRRDEIIELGTRRRGPHDELLRPFSAGGSLRFDILMDIGGFRDMHRHRRCIQLVQPFTGAHGFEDPVCPGQPTLADAGLDTLYHRSMSSALALSREIRDSGLPDAAASAQYLLPLGTRCRSMFKMDFRETLYIAELRSGPAGHFSYRRVAWEIFRAVRRRYPSLATHFRISDVNEPVDLLRR